MGKQPTRNSCPFALMRDTGHLPFFGTELCGVETLFYVQPLASSGCISLGQCHSAPGTQNCPERAQGSSRVSPTSGAVSEGSAALLCSAAEGHGMVRTHALDLLVQEHYDCPEPAAGKSQCLSHSTILWH